MSALELIGREAELAVLRSSVRSIPDGPCAAMLTGESGIGKSLLWQSAVRMARRRGYRVLWCHPAEAESDLSFAAIDDLLGGTLPEVAPTLAEPRRRALVTALLRDEGGTEKVDQRAVSRAALDAVRQIARSGPVLVAVDDVQWLDRPSARVLEFVIRRLEQDPVGILAAMRLDAESGIPLGLDRSIPDERLARIPVGPLSLAGVQRLLRSRLGGSFPRRTLVRLYETSGGNPFFAVELGRAWQRASGGTGVADELPLPETLRAVVGARLASLSAGTRLALRYPAALSHPTVSDLHALVGAGSAAALREAVDAGVLDVHGERVRFTHPILASVIASSMSAAERRVLHETIANVIQEPEERARHLILAAVGPDEKIAHQVEIAARHAEGRGAPEAAATLLEHARTLTPNAHARVAARRGLAAADAFFRAGELPSAEALLTEMLGSASGGRSRADLLFRLAAIRGRAFNFPEAHRLLAEAAAEAGEDRRLRSVIEQELGLLMMMNGNVPKALAHARAAFELASGVDAGLEASSALWVAAFEFIMGGGLPEEAKARLQALEAEPGPSLIGATPWGEPRFFLAFVSKASDDFAGARTRLRHLCRIAADRGDEGVLPFYLCQLSELEFWNGRWDEAERYASEGLRFADLSEQAAVVPVLRYCSALVDAGRGRIDRARRAAELANGGAETTGNLPVIAMARSALGFIDLSLGDYAAAHASMGPVAELLASMGTGEPGLLRVFADEIEALVGLGELDKAGFLVDYLEERGRTLDRPWALATGARSRALLLSALGDLGSASESLDQALAEHERLAMPLELGRTHLVRGAVERRAKRKGNARESLSTAIGLFEELGAPLWARKARTELARVGSRPATPFELTPSERRVAELVAAGKTNREVANTLFISVKTVDSNLTRIYRKLGVRSRTELVGAILTASEAASRE